jgi:hypothetical protein
MVEAGSMAGCKWIGSLDWDGLEEGLGEVGDGAGCLGFYIATNDGGDEAGEGGAEIVGGEVVAGEEVGQVLADGFGGAGADFFWGVVKAEVKMVPVRGVRQRRPSEKVNRHEDARSFLLREDIEVSLKLDLKRSKMEKRK